MSLPHPPFDIEAKILDNKMKACYGLHTFGHPIVLIIVLFVMILALGFGFK
jgi:hypothetical protein